MKTVIALCNSHTDSDSLAGHTLGDLFSCQTRSSQRACLSTLYSILYFLKRCGARSCRLWGSMELWKPLCVERTPYFRRDCGRACGAAGGSWLALLSYNWLNGKTSGIDSTGNIVAVAQDRAGGDKNGD